MSSVKLYINLIGMLQRISGRSFTDLVSVGNVLLTKAKFVDVETLLPSVVQGQRIYFILLYCRTSNAADNGRKSSTVRLQELVDLSYI